MKKNLNNRIPMDTIYKRTIETNEFTSWYSELKDRKVQMRITQRIDRLQLGNPGDFELLGDGVYEMKLHFGPGYRVYYAIEGDVLIILLLGGVILPFSGSSKSRRLSELNQASRRYAADG